MKRARLAIGIGLGAGLVSGCCHLPCRSTRNAPAPLPASVEAQFACPTPAALVCQETNLVTEARFVVRRVELPALNAQPGQERTIKLDCYLPRGDKGPRPVIVVLPTAGGGYQLEKHFAAYFARQGLAAVIVRRPTRIREVERLETIDALFRQSVLDNKRVLDWIESRPELDVERVGVFGVSMGGIQGALLTPLDRRVQAAVLGLVGGDLPYIMTYSTERGVARRRKAFLEERKMTPAELHEKLKAALSCDPNAFAPHVDPTKVMLVLGFCDTVVPYPKGRELREKMGKPETILLPTGHYTSLLYLPYIRRQALHFFRDRLNNDPVAASKPPAPGSPSDGRLTRFRH